MPRVRCMRVLIIAFAVGMLADFGWAETIELVTYYPAPSTPDQHLRSLTVGTQYANESLQDGQVFVYDRVGIGPGFTAAAPPTERLEVVGNVMATSDTSALFKANRGTDTINNGLQLLTSRVAQWTIGSRNGSENLHIYSDASATPATRLLIEQATGNVGIGTAAAPTERLQVMGGNIVAGDTGAGQANVRVGADGIQGRRGVNPGNLALNALGGNVGIGTNAPNAVPSPANGVAAGNLDVNDMFVRSLGLWVSQIRTTRLWSTPIISGTPYYSGTGWTPIATLQVTARGGPVLILGKVWVGTTYMNFPWTDGLLVTRGRVEDSLDYSFYTFGSEVGSGGYGYNGFLNVMATENLPAGTYSYQLYVLTNASSWHVAQNGSLVVIEL